jgi:hypothetical protein
MQSKQADVRQFYGSRHGFCHRIWNVVEFQIKENFGAGVRELRNCSRTLGSEKLAADFKEPDRPAKLLHQSSRGPEAVNIQSNDQSS